ncbi:hypothetical protein AX17_006547 [Amanita inopinata Kibby_2008]|nr:hypothetical protein AX17_006547 [Amanita inopinata Kibby_2008]
MFVPFVSQRSQKSQVRRLDRRLGGGSRGGGGGGGSKSGGSGSKGGSGGGGGRTGGSSRSISTGAGMRPARAFGGGGGPAMIIPSGQLFAGRPAGGGTRSQIYGTSQYGSGYPGVIGRGTTERGFPFYFWPVVWVNGDGTGTGSYLYPPDYGLPTNTSRPGGPLMTAAFVSNSQNNTFRIIADNVTSPEAITAMTYNDTTQLPRPEQVIQYYRASSVVMTLDGYNNTAVLEAQGTPDVPLPSNIDNGLLNCLNETIGGAVPLVDASADNSSVVTWVTPSSLNLVGIAWIIWLFLSLV